MHCGLALFPSTHRGVPMFLNVWDKLSELCLVLALGACLAHKSLAHLKVEIVISIKNRGGQLVWLSG